MVSTKHSVEMVQVRSRYVTHARTKLIAYKILSKYLVPFIRSTSRMMEKPQVVVDYNDYMLGVDKLDQLASYYSYSSAHDNIFYLSCHSVGRKLNLT